MQPTESEMLSTYLKCYGRPYEKTNYLPLPIAYKKAYYRLKNIELKEKKQL